MTLDMVSRELVEYEMDAPNPNASRGYRNMRLAIDAHIAQHAELIAKLRELATDMSTSTYALNSRLMAHTMLDLLDAQPVLTSKSTVINNESRESP
jgi:hypothetical protein